MFVYALFFKINCFSKALLEASVSCHIQRYDFKNSIMAIKLHLMILNLYLISQRSQSKKGVKVKFCGGYALKLHLYNLNSSDSNQC